MDYLSAMSPETMLENQLVIPRPRLGYIDEEAERARDDAADGQLEAEWEESCND